MQGRSEMSGQRALAPLSPRGWMVAVISTGVVSRLLIFAAMGLMAYFQTNHLPQEIGWYLQQLHRWDADWYLSIVQEGYHIKSFLGANGEANYAFFPLYPMLIKALAWISGLAPLNAGILISNLSFVLACVVLGKLLLDLGLSQQGALTGVALMAFVPQSFVFSTVYTESLFLLLTTLYALMFFRKQWLLAGCVGTLVAMTRPNGFLIVLIPLVTFLIELVKSHGWKIGLWILDVWDHPRKWMAFVLPFAGIFAYWWFCFLRTGDAFAQVSTLNFGWENTRAIPFSSTRHYLSSGELKAYIWFFGSFFFFMSLTVLIRHRLFGLLAFAGTTFLIYYASTFPNALLRYSISVFPVYVALAFFLENRPIWRQSILLGFATGNILLLLAWISGHHVAI